VSSEEELEVVRVGGALDEEGLSFFTTEAAAGGVRVEDGGSAEGGFSGEFADDEVFADKGVNRGVEAELGDGGVAGTEDGGFWEEDAGLAAS